MCRTVLQVLFYFFPPYDHSILLVVSSQAVSFKYVKITVSLTSIIGPSSSLQQTNMKTWNFFFILVFSILETVLF